MSEKSYKSCQSCGMPLKRDPQGGGTNADGTMSKKFCSKCYVDGVFQHPEIDTPEKMQFFVQQKMKKMGFPGFLGRMFTKGIPKLERWSK